MRLRLLILERYFRVQRGLIGQLRQGGVSKEKEPAMVRYQLLCGELEQTLHRCRQLA